MCVFTTTSYANQVYALIDRISTEPFTSSNHTYQCNGFLCSINPLMVTNGDLWSDAVAAINGIPFLFIHSISVHSFHFCSFIPFLFIHSISVHSFHFCSFIPFLFIHSISVHSFHFCSFIPFLFIHSISVHSFHFCSFIPFLFIHSISVHSFHLCSLLLCCSDFSVFFFECVQGTRR